MKAIDKKYFKMLDEYPSQWEIEYLHLYPKEQKERFIKIMRGKRREQERRENRICNFLNNIPNLT